MEKEVVPETRDEDKKEDVNKKELNDDEKKDKTEKTDKTDDLDEKEIEKLDKKIKKIKDRKKPPKFMFTVEGAAIYGRRALLKATITSFIIHICFTIVLTIFVTGGSSSDMFLLTDQCRRVIFADSTTDYAFENIQSVKQFWRFTERLFANKLYRSFFFKDNKDQDLVDVKEIDKKFLMNNVILGVPRLRQVRVRNNSCTIHSYFLMHYLNCYGEFDDKAKDVKPFGTNTSGTAWVYTNAEDTGNLPYTGHITTYEGGGYYVDLPETKAEVLDLFTNLEKDTWVTPASRAIFLNFALFNANTDMIVLVELVFELPPVGGVIPSSHFTIVKLRRFVHYYDWVELVCEFMTYIFLFFKLIVQTIDLVTFKWKYFLKFWKYVEMLILICGLQSLVFRALLYVNIPKALVYVKNHHDKYGNVEYVGYLTRFQLYMTAWELFAAYIKMFQYFGITKFMGQVNRTIARSVRDIMGFSVMFFLVFIAYAQLGYLLFGSQVMGFSTFGRAMFSLLRTILGDSDYYELHEADQYLAPIFFISYIFIVFFVLFNMFLAIIDDKYNDVKTEMRVATDNELSFTEYLREIFFKCFNKRGIPLKCLDSKSKREFLIPTANVKRDLERCQFDEDDIRMYFKKMAINPKTKKNIPIIEFGEEPKEEVKDFDNFVHVNDLQTQQIIIYRIQDKIEIINQKLDSLTLKMLNATKK